MIEVNCISHESLFVFNESEVQALFDLLNSKSNYSGKTGTLDVAFLNEDWCKQIHRDFFNDSSVTDVMTFPGDKEENHYGDIAVCPIVAKDVCEENGYTFSEELCLYLIHGWLHLAGLDDQDDSARKLMRGAEKELMHLVAEYTLIPNFSLNPV